MDALGKSLVERLDEPAATRFAFVNHVFAVLDTDTACAIETSVLLRECADLDVKRIEADGGDCWTGRYVSMRKTYVELFGPNDAAAIARPGSIGIALGGDRPGVVDEIDRRLKDRGQRSVTNTRKRKVADREIDWFRHVGPAEEAGIAKSEVPSVDVWAMEYLTGYIDCPEAAKRPSFDAADAVSRLRYNAGTYRDSLLSDLAEAHFAIEPALFAERVRPFLVACDFRLVDRDDGVIAQSDEAGLRFTFVPGPQAGLRELRFHLRERVDGARSETLGRSVLTVGPGDEAHWTFAA